MPGGGLFHPDAPGASRIHSTRTSSTRARGPAARRSRTARQRRADPIPIPTGKSTTVSADVTSIDFYLSDATYTSPYSPGETIRMRAKVGSNPDNTKQIDSPVIAVLLPAEMNYAGNVSISGSAYAAAGNPAPVFSNIPTMRAPGGRWRAGPTRVEDHAEWGQPPPGLCLLRRPV
ncbi:MAG: hypothetical protein R3F11_06395 [Verrucomicrobiales bacterium]